MGEKDLAIWQISVCSARPEDDARGRSILAEMHRAGFAGVSALRTARLYQLSGSLDRQAAEALATRLFADPITDEYRCDHHMDWPQSPHALVEVHLLPGVMDPVALSALQAARDLLAFDQALCRASVDEVRTAWRYEIQGLGSLGEVESAASQVLSNGCIERAFFCAFGRRDALPQHFPEPPQTPFELRTVPLTGLSDHALESLSRSAHLFLSLAEMHAVRDHFIRLKRDPTDIELETIAQTWSEHCVHKTLKSRVTYSGKGFGRLGDAGAQIKRRYENLLKETVVQATRELGKPWCLSVFEDNAGVIEFDQDFGIAFKVETHNHPSAIEPYGGAATGVGGCIRDIMGCGLGAKPIANTDVFCLAPPGFSQARLPQGVLHPRRVLRGVVSGVRDYGNRMGIPTVAGGLCVDDRYLANPLVYVGCVGLIPRDKLSKRPRPGDAIIVVGGRTGRDGIGGATFSSAELTDAHADEFAHAVQIGNAIEEKKVLDAMLRARDASGGCLYSAVTDCGAGGLSSAVGEMAEGLGAVVDLEKAPLKYAGLRYNEIWLSEAQERMVLAVPQENVDRLIGIFVEEESEASVIGTFTGDGVLRLRNEGRDVGDLDLAFLHGGLPRIERTAQWDDPAAPVAPRQHHAGDADLSSRLLGVLADLDVCSRESVFRQYDHEVQSGSVIKPLAGVGEGPTDAAVVRPRLDSHRGVAIGMGMCPGKWDDPYWMAVASIDEAMRNLVCVGADPQRTALLDNFCWGGVSEPEEMGALVRACQACHDAAIAYGTPFISGKDSLNNQFSLSAADAKRLSLPQRIAIPHTLLISALGLVHDVRRCVTADLKRPGHKLICLWSDFRAQGIEACAAMHRAVANHIAIGSVAACHDVSDGGLAVCLAEMCIGGQLGARVDISELATADDLLFDEPRSAYVLELTDEADPAELGGTATVVPLGEVIAEPRLSILRGTETIAAVEVEAMERAWRFGLSLDAEASQ